MKTTAVETATEYIFTVVEGNHTFSWPWGKYPPEGQTVQQYLQICKREAELLATDAIAKMQPPTELAI